MKNKLINSNCIIKNTFYPVFLLIVIIGGCNNTKSTDSTDNKAVKNRKSNDYTQFVNTLVGTPWEGNGGTLPCVGTPFAMTNFVPCTEINSIGGTPYKYENENLIGFMATHQPAVWMGDYGFLSFWPSIDKINLDPKERSWRFNHNNEIAKPHYYETTLNKDGNNIKVSFSASERCALFHFKGETEKAMNLVFEASRSHLFNHRITNMFTEKYRETINQKKKQFKGTVAIHHDKNQIWITNPERHSFHLGPELKNFKCYYIIEIKEGFKNFGTWSNDSIYENRAKASDNWCGGYIEVPDNEATIKISSSFISFDQAQENMQKEIPDWNIDQLAEETKEKWNQKLSTIEITGDTTQKNIFYTAMYHALLYPRMFSEYGKYYSAFDDTIHSGMAYNDYSLWDTYRAEHPLLHFIAPEHVNPMVQSLLNMYTEGGWLPKWPNPAYTSIMIGTHADAVIADAFIKGFRDYDVDKAYEAMRKNAFSSPFGDTGNEHYVQNPWANDSIINIPDDAGNPWWDRGLFNGGYEARGGLTQYIKHGFVPQDYTSESVSRTCEFSYNDYCVGVMANALGHDKDYSSLQQRQQNYQNLYNRENKQMMPKNSDGTWFIPGNEESSGAEQHGVGFTEGSQWTYLFSAVHDIEGMIDMMGGRESFVALLDSNFNGNHYRHNNEPGHHYTYLYNYAGQPWKTQEKVRKYTLAQYKDAPAGLKGNDDCGQMSAWYIFSSLGFYPVCPGSTDFAIGSPLFDKAIIHLPNGKDFTIKTINNSINSPYIKSMELNGKPYNSFVLKYEDIMEGGEMIFYMSDKK